jgi:hypothetical protein
MAAAMIVIAGIGGITSGVNDAVNGNKIRQGICATNKQIHSVTESYNKLLSSQETDIQTLQQEFESNIQQLASQKDTLKTLRENFANSKNQMIIASILFVVSIIVSFLFKKFGLFDMVYSVVFGSGKNVSVK